MKRTVDITLCIMVLLLALYVGRHPAFAAEVSFDKAEDITELDIVEGSNAGPEDDHLYRFDVDHDGYMFFSFEQEKGKGDHVITLFDKDGHEIFRAVCEKEADTYKSPRFSIGKGIKYLRIHSEDNPEKYSLAFQCEKSKRWETEVNNEFAQADEIMADTRCRGSNVSSNDPDCYCFEMEEKGYITLSFDHKKDSGRHDIVLYDSKESELCRLSVEANTETVTSREIGVSSGTCFLKITSEDNQRPYTFSIQSTSCEDWETEPDNQIDQACPVEMDTAYQGSNFDNNDEDFYSFTMDKDDKVVILLNHEKDLADHTITIYDSEKKEISSFKASKDSPQFKSDEIPLKKGTAYIRIQSDENSKPYSLQIKTEE